METTDGRDPTPMSLVQRRDRIIDMLCKHVAGDALTLEDFERRVDLAHQATTTAELDALVADLPAPEPPAEKARTRVAPAARAIANRAEHQFVAAVLGGVERRGAWVPARRSSVFAMMGGAQLDFREAHLPPGVTELAVYAFWGGVEIIVPPGITVESSGVAILGGFGHANEAGRTVDPNGPVLRIDGIAVMGGVEIQVRRPGESQHDIQDRGRDARRRERDARRRERHERRMLRRQRRRALRNPDEPGRA